MFCGHDVPKPMQMCTDLCGPQPFACSLWLMMTDGQELEDQWVHCFHSHSPESMFWNRFTFPGAASVQRDGLFHSIWKYEVSFLPVWTPGWEPLTAAKDGHIHWQSLCSRQNAASLKKNYRPPWGFPISRAAFHSGFRAGDSHSSQLKVKSYGICEGTFQYTQVSTTSFYF